MIARFRPAGRVASLFAVVAALGCGGEAGPRGAALSGTVSIDGTPVETGVIQFVPRDPAAGPPQSFPITGGRYTAVGVPPGPALVGFIAARPTGRTVAQYSTTAPEVVSAIPEKYRDGLPVTVAGDDPALHFRLTSR